MIEKVVLRENERIDDLELNNLKIIQKKDGFCFGIDSILLADFAKKIKNVLQSQMLHVNMGWLTHNNNPK